MKLFDLSGRVALVTGGNGGIGLGMARGLAAAGAAVMIAGRSAAKNAEAVRALTELGAKASSLEVDLTREADCRAMATETALRLGGLHILVNNAGTNIRKRPEEYTLADWRTVIDTNLTSAFLASQGAFPEMTRAGSGKIINVGSMMSIFGSAVHAAYGASKGGLVQFTKSLAVAWAKHNIQVNAVLPGWIDTDLTKRARREIEGLHERVLARTPAGRWGEPTDFAGIAVFLASSASDFVTGAAIPIDGGYATLG
ncbi:MAG: SDR family NAD(P)-dependent oxidoreductase [Stellaceae bacterium]